MDKVECYYTLSGINYKNGFATSCPQQPEKLHSLKEGIILPSEIINSRGFVRHRKEMMSGVWSSGCHLCKDVENANAGKSMRMDFYPPNTSNYNASTGMINFKGLHHAELRFSNSCNMACLHCSEVYSSSWMNKLKDYEADDEDKKHKLIQLTKQMHRDSPLDNTFKIQLSIDQAVAIAEDLNKNFPNLRKVDFAGGEVLYQKQFFPVLRTLANHPNVNNLTICFHTNFNAKFNPKELASLLEPFAKVTVMMSIDAGTNIYSYFRTGDWSVLKSNIEEFKQCINRSNTSLTHNPRTNKKIELNLVCTTSAYQIMDIQNVFESFLTLNMDWINSSIVYTPKYINPSIMMIHFQEYVKKDIADTYEKIAKLGKQTTDVISARTALKNIENYIYNHKSSIDHYNAFLVYIKKTDSIWKQNFNEHFKNYQYVDNQLIRIKK